jgi:PEP-CTERM motif
MKLRQLACVAALAVVGAGAQASTTSLYSFTLGAPAPVLITSASAGSGNEIVSFEVISQTPFRETPDPLAYTLVFKPLAAGTYQVKLVTTQPLPISISASVNSTPITLSAVPEPEAYAMVMAGLGVAGLVLRRRSAGRA